MQTLTNRSKKCPKAIIGNKIAEWRLKWNTTSECTSAYKIVNWCGPHSLIPIMSYAKKPSKLEDNVYVSINCVDALNQKWRSLLQILCAKFGICYSIFVPCDGYENFRLNVPTLIEYEDLNTYFVTYHFSQNTIKKIAIFDAINLGYGITDLGFYGLDDNNHIVGHYSLKVLIEDINSQFFFGTFQHQLMLNPIDAEQVNDHYILDLDMVCDDYQEYETSLE